MIKITCDMCTDLMPLVQDGVASEDSIVAVEHHIKTCPECKSMFEGQVPIPSDGSQIMKKIQRKVRLFMGMMLMFGVFFGLSLTASGELFLNSFIMPIIGGIGYYLFRWRALYLTPVLLLITHFFTNSVGMMRGMESLDVMSVVMWSGIYSLFAIIGIVIAGLIHFAFRKEN